MAVEGGARAPPMPGALHAAQKDALPVHRAGIGLLPDQQAGGEALFAHEGKQGAELLLAAKDDGVVARYTHRLGDEGGQIEMAVVIGVPLSS